MFGRSAWQRRELFTQSVPIFAAIYSLNEAPDALSDYALRTNSGSFATFAAIRRASSGWKQKHGPWRLLILAMEGFYHATIVSRRRVLGFVYGYADR
jgi:hypothetical protein